MLALSKPVPTLEELERASWLPPELIAERDRLRALAASWEHAQREGVRRQQDAAEARHRAELARRRILPSEPRSAADRCVFDRRQLAGVFLELDGAEYQLSGQTVSCISPELMAAWKAQHPNGSLTSVSPATLESLPDAVAKTWPVREITNFDGQLVRPKCVQIAVDVVAATRSRFWLERWLKSARNQGDRELEEAIKRRYVQLGIYGEPPEAA